jgi:PAS domain S-box-containing protein
MNQLPSGQSGLDILSGDRRFELLVDAIRDYAIYLLDADGCVRSWNSGAQRFQGYTADEIIGRHFSLFYTEEDRASGLPVTALDTARRDGRYEAEGLRVRKDGSRFWTTVVIEAVLADDGQLIGFAKITRDITERRAAQRELDAARETLAQAQKMEAVGRLTGGLAHDFNNLLTIIRSSSELLRMPGLGEEKRTRYIDVITETADRAAGLTGQLLAFARRQPLRTELFAIAERIEGLRQVINTTLGSPVTLSIDVAEDVGSVNADPNQFEAALLNMVINAKDAMPTGGRLAISAHTVEAGEPAWKQQPARIQLVAVTIEDSGTGIDPEALERIFEPFYTTKDVSKGTGLGLSQVYGFAKQSGGEIDVVSRAGEGTRFTLFLPRTEGTTEAGIEREAIVDTAPIAPGSRTLLLVEDNEGVGRMAVDLLSELGLAVAWATTGEAALEILASREGAFDLVFSDIVMPGINGLELAMEIRKRWPMLRVVLATGYSEALSDEGSHGFELVPKPYTADGLKLRLLSPAPPTIVP